MSKIKFLMRWATCLSLITVVGTIQAQQQRIVVDHNGNAQVFLDLQSAVTAALPNSELYLSGGSFLLPTGFALSKTLHFIGAGINPDSTNTTGATIITAPDQSTWVRLSSAASGSSFTGIVFNMQTNVSVTLGVSNVDQTVQSVEFRRCVFHEMVNLGVAEPSFGSAQFTECIFHAQLNGYGSSAVVTRSIFDWVPSTSTGTINIFRPSGLNMNNCVILGGWVANTENATIQNCVFTRQNGAPFWQGSTTTFNNCLIGWENLFHNDPTVSGTGNIFNQGPDSFFVSEGDGKFQFSDDLHLLVSSPGNNAGTDGTDIGIYGTNSPFKPGSVPHTPHFSAVGIAGGTNAAGNLPVQVKVAVQPD